MFAISSYNHLLMKTLYWLRSNFPEILCVRRDFWSPRERLFKSISFHFSSYYLLTERRVGQSPAGSLLVCFTNVISVGFDTWQTRARGRRLMNSDDVREIRHIAPPICYFTSQLLWRLFLYSPQQCLAYTNRISMEISQMTSSFKSRLD